MPWWGWVLVVGGSLLVGGLVGAAAVAYYIGNGMRKSF
jgi:hypothetical protein